MVRSAIRFQPLGARTPTTTRRRHSPHTVGTRCGKRRFSGCHARSLTSTLTLSSASLRCHRDRALVAFYVSSGARASELLSLTGDMVNYGDQLIGVIRKGGGRQWLPASPDAFVWLRLYQLERGAAPAGQPVWLTLREPHRALSYDALRAVMARVNSLLGSNWTLHDLRHTFAIRALDGGVPMHEVQELLGHASLQTLTVYAKPRLEDVVAHHRAVFGRPTADEQADPAPVAYDSEALATVFGRR